MHGTEKKKKPSVTSLQPSLEVSEDDRKPGLGSGDIKLHRLKIFRPILKTINKVHLSRKMRRTIINHSNDFHINRFLFI